MPKRPAVIDLAIAGNLRLLENETRIPGFFSQANCIDAEPDLFFSENPLSIRRAKSICGGCPVRSQCLNWARENTDEGIYGGKTPSERVLSRNNLHIVDISEICAMRDDLEIILRSEIEVVVTHFKVNERTVYRWRNLLAELPLAS